jgi:hypothetical protein
MKRHDEFDDDYLDWDDLDKEVDTKEADPVAAPPSPQSRVVIFLFVVVIALQAFQLFSGHMFKSDVRKELDNTNELIKVLQERRVVNELEAIRKAKKAQ